MTLSNFDIEKICKFYKLPIVAITMKDELPRSVKNGCYVINMQSSSEGNGTHWVALFIYKTNAFYFDSFGGLPPVEIMKFVKKRKECHLYYNNWIIQNIKSSQCGWYCIAFLKHMYQNLQQDLKVAYNDFVNNFADDTTRNDDILRSFFASWPNDERPGLIKKFLK
jgi:hypothetical protein